MVSVTSDFEKHERLERISRMDLRDVEVELREQRDRYYYNLARTLSVFDSPVDQRDIDYKRGFWNGALWVAVALPKKAGKDLHTAILKAIDDREVNPGDV